MTDTTVVYPSLVSSTMKELVEFFNQHSDKPVKKFKNLDTGRTMVQQVIARLEGTSDPEMEEEAEELVESTIAAQVEGLIVDVPKTSDKNEGVWLNVQRLLNDGLSNKAIVAELQELYGNSNTSYACVAWYRNKWKKMTPAIAPEEVVNAFLEKHQLELTAEAFAELVSMVK